MKTPLVCTLTGVLLFSSLMTGCETPGQGAANGAVAGALTGALVSDHWRAPLVGALVGMGVGAAAGAANQDARERAYAGGYYEGPEVGYRVRVARFSDWPGYVVSPYRPHALVDVRRIRPGARVWDPASNRVFVNP